MTALSNETKEQVSGFAGYAAIVPDFYHGKSLPSDKSKIMEFIGQFPTDKVWPVFHMPFS